MCFIILYGINMDTLYIKKFTGTPFIIECTSIENHPGIWNSVKVSIFSDNILIGEYLRNYSKYAQETFFPFLVGEDWYALYSSNYTATRVMKLYEDRIEDWCGESPSLFGFCPVEIYVPRYNKYSVIGEGDYCTVDTEYTTSAEFIAEQDDKTFVESKYCNFGFLSGCVWGDDSNWKLLYIDLFKVANKELSITEKFGYWELPIGTKLKECINMHNWEPDHEWVDLTRVEHINLKTGERC